MHLHLRGENIPEALCEALAAITDNARLNPTGVAFDDISGSVQFPIERYPLIRQRRVRSNLHDWSNPIQSTLTVRRVVSCRIEDITTSGPEEPIHLLFGVRVRDDEIYLCSAEEDRGSTCFSVTIDITGVDIELNDDPRSSE
ncbi:hypothetical protein ACFL6R_01205 [Gemmatimonadota bacterium]